MRSVPTLFTGVILGALVWFFAIIGLLSVTAAAPEEPPAPVSPLLSTSEVAGQDIADIPRYPDAQRIDYRRTPFRDVTYIGITYVAEAPVDDVRSFYRSELGRHGWGIVDARVALGESTYVLEHGSRIARIEIRPVDAVVEIEIELDEPGTSRGTTTDR